MTNKTQKTIKEFKNNLHIMINQKKISILNKEMKKSSRNWSIQVPITQMQQDKILSLAFEQKTTNNKLKWQSISQIMHTKIPTCQKTGKQCRQRWHNHLAPQLNNSGTWTQQQNQILFQYHNQLGNKWSKISSYLKGRTDNCVKNHFYSTLRRGMRIVNNYIHENYKKQPIKQFKPDVLSKILIVVDGNTQQKLIIKNNAFILAKNIKQLLIKISLKYNQLYFNSIFFNSIIQNITEFNKNCKKRKGKKNIHCHLKSNIYQHFNQQLVKLQIQHQSNSKQWENQKNHNGNINIQNQIKMEDNGSNMMEEKKVTKQPKNQKQKQKQNHKHSSKLQKKQNHFKQHNQKVKISKPTQKMPKKSTIHQKQPTQLTLQPTITPQQQLSSQQKHLPKKPKKKLQRVNSISSFTSQLASFNSNYNGSFNMINYQNSQFQFQRLFKSSGFQFNFNNDLNNNNSHQIYADLQMGNKKNQQGFHLSGLSASAMSGGDQKSQFFNLINDKGVFQPQDLLHYHQPDKPPNSSLKQKHHNQSHPLFSPSFAHQQNIFTQYCHQTSPKQIKKIQIKQQSIQKYQLKQILDKNDKQSY